MEMHNTRKLPSIQTDVWLNMPDSTLEALAFVYVNYCTYSKKKALRLQIDLPKIHPVLALQKGRRQAAPAPGGHQPKVLGRWPPRRELQYGPLARFANMAWGICPGVHKNMHVIHMAIQLAI